MTDLGTTRRIPALGASLGTLLLVLAACSTTASPSPTASAATSASVAASASEAAEGPSVTISGSSSFGTAEVTVPAGQTLTVTNASSVAHTFTEGENGQSVDDARVNETLEPGTSVQVTFPEPGDYNITCGFHSNMNMVVHVE